MKKTFLTILFLLVGLTLVMTLFLHCGGPQAPTRSKTIGELGVTDWSWDDNGNFSTCPMIVGFDDDGDCIPNAYDPDPFTPNDWKQVCHQKYASIPPEDAEKLCMNDYEQLLADAGGPDLEDMLMLAGAENLGSILGATSGLLGAIAGWFGGDGGNNTYTTTDVAGIKTDIMPASPGGKYPDYFEESDIVGKYKITGFENNKKINEGWINIDGYSVYNGFFKTTTKGNNAEIKDGRIKLEENEKEIGKIKGRVIFVDSKLLFLISDYDRDTQQYLFPKKAAYYAVGDMHMWCDKPASLSCSMSSYPEVANADQAIFDSDSKPAICDIQLTSYNAYQESCKKQHMGDYSCQLNPSLPEGSLDSFTLYGEKKKKENGKDVKVSMKVVMEKVADESADAPVCYYDDKKSSDTLFEVK